MPVDLGECESAPVPDNETTVVTVPSTTTTVPGATDTPSPVSSVINEVLPVAPVPVAQLPRTGTSSSKPLVELGAGMLLLGIGLRKFTK
jgi:LPXTG-motif cell wall-anchored protein